MGALGQFLRDSGAWGVASEVAAAAVFGVGIWEHFHDRPITGYSLLIVSVLLFWAGAYAAWLKKNRENKTLSDTLNDRSPKLQLTLEQIHYSYDAQRDATIFILSAFLLNAGEPSVAISWRAVYHVGESKEIMTSFYIISSYIIAHRNESIALTNDHLLQTKVLTHRLERGDAKAGRLIFTVPGNRIEQIRSCQYSIEVSCADFLGRISSAIFRPDPKPIPGLTTFPGEQIQVGATQPEATSYTEPPKFDPIA